MSDTIVWVHDDALRPTNPALAANPDASAIFVFDNTYLAERKISLKRVMFMYECLLELPVIIRRGDVAAEVVRFAAEHSATRVVTTESPDPRLKSIYEMVRKALPAESRLDVIPDEQFAEVEAGRLNLKRFTRYWSVAKRFAMTKKP